MQLKPAGTVSTEKEKAAYKGGLFFFLEASSFDPPRKARIDAHFSAIDGPLADMPIVAYCSADVAPEQY